MEKPDLIKDLKFDIDDLNIYTAYLDRIRFVFSLNFSKSIPLVKQKEITEYIVWVINQASDAEKCTQCGVEIDEQDCCECEGLKR